MTAITSTEVPWEVRQRIESLAGEARVNVIRLAAVFAFYLRHTIAMLVSPAGPEAGRYHLGATCVAAAWFAAVVAIHLCISRRYLPPWLKYAACAFDLLMVTMLGILRADPRSPIVLLYFPVIVSAALRMSLGLIYFATAGAGVGYLAVLANYAWFVVGRDRYYSTPTTQIPRGDEALFLLALIVTGIFAGQLVRQARRLTIPYPRHDRHTCGGNGAAEMSTTVFCPRCGVEMSVASARVRDVSCPYCLAHVKLDPPMPVLPLEYAGPQVDADAELRRDQSTMAAGILVFALMATATLLCIKIKGQVPVSNIYIFGWVGFLTVIVALRRFTGLAERRMSTQLGIPQQPRTPMQRAGSIALLGVWGVAVALLSLFIGAVALVVILFLVCTGV